MKEKKFIQVYEPFKAKNQKKYVLKCLDDNMLTFRGSYVSEFEERLQKLLGVKHVITTFNGTVSLYLILYCLGIKPGDEVITCSLTYAATVSQPNLLGATVVLVDSDNQLQMDVGLVEKSITAKTKAIIVPELYSDAPNLKELASICKRRKIHLVEDSAESFYCKQGSKYIGTFGIASSFSFFANKVITGGEAGVVCTNDDLLAEKMRLFKNQSHIGSFQHLGPGTNFRLTNLQAAIALAQLEDLPKILKKKQEIARFYRQNLPKEIVRILPKLDYSSEWMPVFELPDTITYENFSSLLLSRGVETRPVFTPVHLMKGWDNIKRYTSVANSEKIYKSKFNLPSYPTLTKSQLNYIVECVKWAIKRER